MEGCMKKLLLVSAALLCLGASFAQAEGVNLAWKNCITQATAAADIVYLCDGSLNGTPFKLVPSFVTDTALPQFVGMQAVIDVRSDQANLPDWWKLGSGECRQGNIVFPAGFIGVGTGATGACQNPWAGGNIGGGYQWNTESKGDPTNPSQVILGWGRLKLALARDTEVALVAGQQYVAGVITLDTAGDVDLGSGVCAGCLLPACLVLNQVELYQTVGAPGGDKHVLTAPITRSYVTWQGGSIGGAGCPASVPCTT